MEKTFNYSLTLIGSISLNECDVRSILELSSDTELTEKHWNQAVKHCIEKEIYCSVDSLDDFNDIEIEEQKDWGCQNHKIFKGYGGY